MPERKLTRHRAGAPVGLMGLLLVLVVLMAGCATAVDMQDAVDVTSPAEAPPVGTPQASQPARATGTPQPISDPASAASTKEGSLDSGSYDDYEEHNGRYTEIEFRGVVSAIDSGVVVVNGQQVIIPAGMNVSSLQVGSYIKVEAWLNADGQLTAKEIELEDAPYSGDSMADDDHDDGADDHDVDDDSGSGQREEDNSGSGSDDGSDSEHHDDEAPDDSGDSGDEEDGDD